MACEIKFVSSDSAVVEHFPVIPTKKIVPEWYKKIPMTYDVKYDNLKDLNTIRHCMPVQDMITAGYIISNTYEFVLNTKKIGPYEDFWYTCNHDSHVEKHHHAQCPIDIKGKKKHYFKFNNPWKIRTPPGYSCLFIQPFYLMEERYTLLPAIVDTDLHDVPVSLPGYINEGVDEINVKAGEPIMQVIPFKRDAWEMTCEFEQTKFSKLLYVLKSSYRSLFHQKKSWN